MMQEISGFIQKLRKVEVTGGITTNVVKPETAPHAKTKIVPKHPHCFKVLLLGCSGGLNLSANWVVETATPPPIV